MIKKLLPMLLAVIMASCATNKKADNSAPTITVSILPQKYFVEQIAGDLFSINVMIPPGASPATYEPTPAQLVALSETAIYMKIGYTAFELSWMEKLKSANDEMNIVDLSEGVSLIMEQSHQHGSHQHGSVDPHIWLSPKNVKIISENIYKSLSSAYPENEALFSKNLKSFYEKLDSLDHYISAVTGNFTSRSFMIYHPALSYYAKDYHLDQYPLELEGKTPSSTYMKELVDMAKSEDIRVVFLQMQFDEHNAEALAREIGAEIVQINPLDPEWYKQMIYITEKLQANLK